MAAIAKFISFDGGIAFSESVVKFQKRSGDAKLFPLGEIDSINVRKPQQDNRGFVRLQTRDGKLYRVFFEDEQYAQALSFKKQLDAQLRLGPAPAPEPEPEPVREEPDDSQHAEQPEERPARRRRREPVAADVEDDAPSEPAGEGEDEDEPYEEPSLLRRWWFWLIVVLLVVAIAAAAALIVLKLKTDQEPPAAPVNTSAITIPAPVDVPDAPAADIAPAEGAAP